MCGYSGVPHSAREEAKSLSSKERILTLEEFVSSRANSGSAHWSLERADKEYQVYVSLFMLKAHDPKSLVTRH